MALIICQVLHMSQFWILQGCQYDSVLNYQVYTGIANFCKYDRFLNLHWMQLRKDFEYFQDTKYAKFLSMWRLHKSLNTAQYGRRSCYDRVFWICLVKVSQGFENVSGSKYPRVQNMTRLWYARVTQGSQYARVSVNIP